MTTVGTAQSKDIRLPRPHGAQLDILNHSGSCVIFAGRRFGKTQVGVYKILRAATEVVGLYWWVGLSWRSASTKRAWRLLKFYVRKIWRALGQKPDNYIREAEKELTFPNGSAVWLRTAEREDSLAGEAVRGMVVDEFSLMSESVWTEYLEATLLDYDGWALFIGVPKGENWAAQHWRKAKTRQGWRQFKFTSYDNPHIPAARIDDVKLNTPHRIFEQEYMAEVLPDGGAVFRRIRDAAYNADGSARVQRLERALEGHRYACGVDLAKSNDYTVFVVIDLDTREVVYLDRFSDIDFTLQLERLVALHERFAFESITIEINFNEMFAEQAIRRELPVDEWRTTAQSKPTLIETLAVAFERSDIAIIDDEDLINELQIFTTERTPSGLAVRYTAPEGMHDDIVIALALAWRAAAAPSFILFTG